MFPFGLGPDENGTGTTPEGLQRVLSARYRAPGIIDDVNLALSATELAVAVGHGAVAVKVGTGLLVEAPIQPQTLPIPAPPASGSRTDKIWVEGTDGTVRVGGAVSATGQEIGQVTVPAGATRGNQCQLGADRTFATHPGSALGQLKAWIDPEPNDSYVIGSTTTLCTLRIPPMTTDRLVDVEVHQSNWTKGNVAAAGAAQYQISINGEHHQAILIEYNQFRVQRHVHIPAVLNANRVNTVEVKRVGSAGGHAYRFRGKIDAYTYQATTVRVMDRGGVS